MEYLKCPERFLEARVTDMSLTPPLLSLCAGYESGQWRAMQFAEHLMEWLPEFCLKFSEIEGLGSHNALRLLKQAASNVYSTEKFKNRGEVGEIILHAAIRQEFNTIPLISKIYYKDSANDTVKGFDCAHVVDNNDKFELWLGEVKLYQDFAQGARDVCAEIEKHTKNDYLRKEFIAICNKVDDKHPSSKKAVSLLSKNTSLDKIFPNIVIPVLITYESKSIANYHEICNEFMDSIKVEIRSLYDYFKEKLPTTKANIHLLTIPLGQKKELLDAFDKELGRLR